MTSGPVGNELWEIFQQAWPVFGQPISAAVGDWDTVMKGKGKTED